MPTPSPLFRLLILAALTVSVAVPAHAKARTIEFSGHTWTVRANGKGGPGPNHWSARNVRVDKNGDLHLKLTNVDGVWHCASLQSTDAMGFGTYQFWLDTRVDNLDPNVVLGLFNYTTPDVGPDGTNEIDIEFARWGRAKWPNGNYTVYPAEPGNPPTSHSFELTDENPQSTHRFIWSGSGVKFQSLAGYQNKGAGKYQAWSFAPNDPRALIPQKPLPVHINLWLTKGHAPRRGHPVEVVIRRFDFTPADQSSTPSAARSEF